MPPSPLSENRSFSPDDSFHRELKAGALRRADAGRVAALAVEFVHDLHFALVENLGDSAQDVLYRTGYEWGLQDMLRLNQHLREEIGGSNFDLWQMDAKFVIDSWWAALAESGWGTCQFDFSRLSRGVVCAELKDSIVAQALDGAEQPVCHLYAGLFAGALSFFERAERHAVEIQCQAMAHDSCRFVIGPGAEVDNAESRRQQGASATEIIRRLS